MESLHAITDGMMLSQVMHDHTQMNAVQYVPYLEHELLQLGEGDVCCAGGLLVSHMLPSACISTCTCKREARDTTLFMIQYRVRINPYQQ